MTISLITRGLISPIIEGDITVQKIVYPLTLNLTSKKPKLTLTIKRKEILSLSTCK